MTTFREEIIEILEEMLNPYGDFDNYKDPIRNTDIILSKIEKIINEKKPDLSKARNEYEIGYYDAFHTIKELLK